MRRLACGKALALAFIVAAWHPCLANLLADPSFEATGSGGWDLYVSHSNFQFDPDSTLEAHSGSQSCRLSWSSPIPAWNVADAAQTISVTPGLFWTASVYAKITTALDSPAAAYLETIFYNASWQEVGKIASPQISGVTDWTQLSNAGVVSNGAAYARYRLVVFNMDGVSDSGTIYWDDASADAVIPEPASAALLGVGLVAAALSRRSRR